MVAVYRQTNVYFLTFSYYATWLLGNEKGSFRWNSQRFGNEPALLEYMRNHCKAPKVVFDKITCALVHDAISDVCREKGWHIDALNVRSTHIHAILYAPNFNDPNKLVGVLKFEIRKHVKEELDFKEGAKVWTKGSGNLFVDNIAFWRAKVDYVLNQQGDNFYLRFSKLGRNWIEQRKQEEKEKTGRKQGKARMQDLYGGETIAKERFLYFESLKRRPDENTNENRFTK